MEGEREEERTEGRLDGMTWRTAKSLQVLTAECDVYAPHRSKSLDGTIGDEAHQSRPSAHNPNDFGVVCAKDITHDPAGGMDVHKLARRITTDPPPSLTYIISNRQVARWSNGWQWVAYKGAAPHTGHAHFRVGKGPDSEPRPPYDDTTPWRVAELMGQEEDDMTPEQDNRLKRLELGNLARSYDMKILEAKIDGNAAEVSRLRAEREAKIAAKKAELRI